MALRTRVELGRREDLGADCASCFGLCCVALAFARSADFPFNKPAGDTCVNLDDRDACQVHSELRPRGFKGCIVFDCFGAGQKVSQHTFEGRSWRGDAQTRTSMFAVFPIVRRLHELLWYLDQALSLPGTGSLRNNLSAHFERVQSLSDQTPQLLGDTDVDREYDTARPLLIAASKAARSGKSGARGLRHGRKRIGPGSDLLGADFVGADLRGAELRGSVLIGADLTDADLSWCDVLGVDLRDANLAGAQLERAIYLTQMQVNSARGDKTTALPPGFERPTHW
jgi:hypothetical protein